MPAPTRLIALTRASLRNTRGTRFSSVISSGGPKPTNSRTTLQPFCSMNVSASASDSRNFLTSSGCFAAHSVFAAGAGPGSGPDRKRTVDYGAAIALIALADALRLRAIPTPQLQRHLPEALPLGVSRQVELELHTTTAMQLELADLHPPGWQVEGMPVRLALPAHGVARVRYRLVVETASDAIVITDRDRAIIFANPAALALFGFPGSSLIGMPVADVLPPEARDHVAAYESAALDGAPQRYETDVLRADGSPRVQVLAGNLNGVGRVLAPGLRARNVKNGTLVALALDGKPLVQSKRFMIKMVTDARNLDEVLDRIRLRHDAHPLRHAVHRRVEAAHEKVDHHDEEGDEHRLLLRLDQGGDPEADGEREHQVHGGREEDEEQAPPHGHAQREVGEGEPQRQVDHGRFWLEANDLSAVQLCRVAGLPFVAGPTLNVYNHRAMAMLVEDGLRRWVPGVEQGRQLVAELRDGMRADGLAMPELEVIAWGRLPLSFSARCFTARALDLPKDQCGFRCIDYPDGMPLATREGRPFLRINGIQVQGEEVTDLGPELPSLRALGVDLLRIYPQARGCREVVEHFDLARQSMTPPPRMGARNGYWHGEPGMRPVEPQAMPA